jgi:hypothetical protein
MGLFRREDHLLHHVVEGYRAMAADEEYERDAQEWSENLAGDVAAEHG